ncbi:MAG TPA: histidine kinase, partial [Clostridia bacterium]|nr:histidine kinase [Clostridia bacterium]
MKKSNVQHLDWGRIEWIYEPEYDNSTNIMHIGITTLFPGMRQTRHVHYGDEQFLYVLSGKGHQLIGDEVTIIEPGSNCHIEAGSVHETINMGNEPLVQLLISIPANFDSSLPLQDRASALHPGAEGQEAEIKIDNKIGIIYDGLINSLKIPLSIFDEEDKVVIEGRDYPEYCRHKCSIGENLHNCCMYDIRDNYSSPHYRNPSAFICPYGLTVFVIPIQLRDRTIGFIRGGHLGTSPDSPDYIPEARMKAILIQIKKLSKSIVDYYVFESTELQLGKKEEIIQDISRHEMLLEESLKSTQEKVLSIQMNNHFLFNTLNALAGLAVKENAFKTYESIISLSKMFRHSLKTGSTLVTLKDELDYAIDFVELQKLRYGERLKVNFSIAEEIKDILLPFHCLQPILENCFVHGFKDKTDELLIEVSGIMEQNNIVIEIRDNGGGIDAKTERALNGMLKQSNAGEVPSGLMMIYSKLQLYYNRDFTFEISGGANKGTSVKLT